MTIMRLDIKPIPLNQGYPVISEFMPDIGDRFGYNLGVKSHHGLQLEKEPFQYKSAGCITSVSCPFVQGYQPAISMQIKVEKVPGQFYSSEHEQWAEGIHSRFALVFAPQADGQFLVLFGTAKGDDSDITDQTYNYKKAFDDACGRFFMLVNDITSFLLQGKI